MAISKALKIGLSVGGGVVGTAAVITPTVAVTIQNSQYLVEINTDSHIKLQYSDPNIKKGSTFESKFTLDEGWKVGELKILINQVDETNKCTIEVDKDNPFAGTLIIPADVLKGDVVITVSSQRIECSIRFNEGEHGHFDEFSSSIYYGQQWKEVTKPEVNVEGGYELIGWQFEQQVLNEEDVIKKDMTVTAIYGDATYDLEIVTENVDLKSKDYNDVKHGRNQDFIFSPQQGCTNLRFRVYCNEDLLVEDIDYIIILGHCIELKGEAIKGKIKIEAIADPIQVKLTFVNGIHCDIAPEQSTEINKPYNSTWGSVTKPEIVYDKSLYEFYGWFDQYGHEMSDDDHIVNDLIYHPVCILKTNI